MSKEITEQQVVIAARQTAMTQVAEEIKNLDWDDIRKYYAPKATDKEFALYLDACVANRLDPRKKEAYFVKYGDNPGQVITGYLSYIKQAERSGLLDGWNVKITPEGNEATVEIYRKDWEQPFLWTVDRDEFDKKQSTWKTMPRFMLKKVAIAQAFRIAFSDEVGGMPYTSEELSTFVDDNTAEVINTVTTTPEIKPVIKTPVKKATKKEKKTETPKEEPTTVKTESIEFIDEETKDKVLKAFKPFNITESLITSILGTDDWTMDMKDWLLEQFHKCNNKILDAIEFANLEYTG